MRTAFIQELIEQARRREELFLVVGDLGFSVVEPFAAEFPNRFLNAGVAEQNMTGVAAGLASEGYHVFTYSIANFPTLRCLEQIRNDLCYHALPVTVVSVGAGMAYGNLGYSHHALQDLAIMRALPELTVLSPADPGETRECVQWLAANPRPSYLRVGKAGEPDLHRVRGVAAGPMQVALGRADFALVATGSILRVALEAVPLLAQQGLQPPVYSCPWLQPVCSAFFEQLHGFRTIFVLEEHLATGGLSATLREHLPYGVRVVPLAVPRQVLGRVGSQEYLRRQAGLDATGVAAAVLKDAGG